MIRNTPVLFIILLLIASACIAGCSMNIGTPAPTTVPPTVQAPATTLPTPEPTTVLPATTVATTIVTTAPTEKEVLHEKGILTTSSYKTYDFKTLMGYKFLYPKDRFRITIRSEKPVLGYAVSSEQAGQLQGSQLIPKYESYIKGGINWGLIEPVMVIEKATDTTKEFTLKDVGSLTYVVDGRWMGYDSNYNNVGPFNYEIIIVKTGGPTKQSFDFAGYDANGTVDSRKLNEG